MDKSYLIDVLVRGNLPHAAEAGDEPIIVAIRLEVRAPENIDPSQLGEIIGDRVQDIGLHMMDHSDQVGESIDQYEEALEEVLASKDAGSQLN